MQLKNRESLFFGLIFLLNLVPLFSGSYFITFDGPAHLYNSNIINSLVLDKQSFYYEYYTWNDDIVPNWIGHFILGFFGYFLPSFVAEKMLMIIYSATLCYGFRYLIKTISKGNIFISYLVFPFVYMFFFFMGFYNFLLGLGIMLFSLGLFIKLINSKFTLKGSLTLFVLLVLLYFSHAVPMAVFMVFVAFYFTVEFIKIIAIAFKRHEFKLELKKVFQNIFLTLVIGSIPFFLLLRHFYIRSDITNNSYMSSSELFSYFTEMKFLIGLNSGYESFYLELFFYLIFVLLLVGVVYKVLIVRKRIEPRNQEIKQITGWPLTILLMSILMGVFYFTLPFSDALASYINTRFVVLFFLLLLVWMSTLKFPLLVKIITFLLVFYVGYNLNDYYYDNNKVMTKYPSDIISLSEKIPEKSVVLPINFSNHWMFAHFSNYLGAERDLIILENYECVQDYFPIRWNKEEIPNLLLGEELNSEFNCGYWETNYSNEKKKIDYVFVIARDQVNEESDCLVEIDSLLNRHFRLFNEKGVFKLYKAKS